MFRKIHSNREPDATLWKAIRQEFASFYERADSLVRGIVEKYPIRSLVVMVCCIILSAVLSFTVFSQENVRAATTDKPDQPAGKKQVRNANVSFGMLMEKTSAITETYRLKARVDSILSRSTLSKADSNALLDALGQLRILQSSKPIKNEARP